MGDSRSWRRPVPSRLAWLLLLAVLGFVPGVYLVGALTSPFSWEERDWDDSGSTSPGEYLFAVELGARPARCPDGTLGTEYFLLKDGLDFKVDCSRRWTDDPERWRL